MGGVSLHLCYNESMEKELLYAYMAGLVDGEGTISVKSESKTRPYTGYLTICNTNYDVMLIFEQEFGGKVRKRNWSSSQKNISQNWKPCYEWQLSKHQAAKVVQILLPYIKIKKRQGILLLRLDKIKQRYNRAYKRWHPEIGERCNRIYAKIKDECKKLNKRGLK